MVLLIKGLPQEILDFNGVTVNEPVNNIPARSLLILKIPLCCDSCNQKLIDSLKKKGLETITMDVEKSSVTVKSSVDLTELRLYFKDKLKKDFEIIDTAEVAFPTKRKNSTIYKKEVDDKATLKKDVCSTAAFNMKCRGGRKEDKNKDNHNNGEKNNSCGRETKPNVFSIDGAGKERSRDDEGGSSSKKDKDRDGMTKVNAEIYYRSNQMGGDTDKNHGSEEKLKKGKKIHKNIISNKKTKESSLILKIPLCCDACNRKLINNLTKKGLETITMDVEKSLVTVKCSVDLTELRSYFKDKLKKDVEIIDPAEVAFLTKRKNSTIYKKEIDDKATHKKDGGSTAAFSMQERILLLLFILSYFFYMFCC